ncbi:phosphopantetheine-binding protein [Nocardia sp. NPDC051030]|uniref:phosphopantetheine-binding protein n=1 Tax=Nocardia sp. NPDC051030 TaxID=3155162 RepID=UPI003412EE1B
MSTTHDKPAPPTLDDLRTAVAEMVGVTPADVPLEANLYHMGVTSLGMMRLANRWRRAGIRVSFRDLSAEPTLHAWQRFLAD